MFWFKRVWLGVIINVIIINQHKIVCMAETLSVFFCFVWWLVREMFVSKKKKLEVGEAEGREGITSCPQQQPRPPGRCCRGSTRDCRPQRREKRQRQQRMDPAMMRPSVLQPTPQSHPAYVVSLGSVAGGSVGRGRGSIGRLGSTVGGGGRSVWSLRSCDGEIFSRKSFNTQSSPP